MPDTIACILTTHNPDPWLLSLALKSTEPVFDYTIVIDDGSDNPVPDAAVRLKRNHGVAAALNVGLSICDCDWYSAFADDDEYMVPAIALAKRIRSGEFTCGIVDFNVEIANGHWPGYLWNGEANYAKLTDDPQIAGQSFIRRSVWESLRGYRGGVFPDWEFTARAYYSGFIVRKENAVCVRYRLRPGTMTAHHDSDKLTAQYKATRKAIADFLERDKL